MLSRRDKLLLQPWNERRYKDHRSKVRSALPAIDDAAPLSRPHVTVKLKKCQREKDRKAKIENDNYNLLQRLNAIMKVNRLDNHWRTPLPNFRSRVSSKIKADIVGLLHGHCTSPTINFHQKVGLYLDAASLARVGSPRGASEIGDLALTQVTVAYKCYACEVRRQDKARAEGTGREEREEGDSLPLIFKRTQVFNKQT